MRSAATITGVLVLLLIGRAVGGGTDLRRVMKLLSHRKPGERLRAVKMLEEIPGRGSLLLTLEAVRDPDAEVRERAVRALGERRTPEDLRLLADRVPRHRDPRVRRIGLSILVAGSAPGVDEAVVEALDDADPGVREAAAGLVQVCLGGRGPDVLAAAVLRGREGRPRAAALLALDRIAPELARELAGKLLSHRAYEARVAALEVIANGPPGEAAPALVAGLQDGSWSVRLTAVRLLADLRAREGVPGLIRALRRERGRMLAETGDALAGLTGIGFPPDPVRWEAWWAKEGKTFAVPEKPAPVEDADRHSVATFHSIPIRSESIAFVIDRSRSMRDRLERGEERTKGDLVEAELAATLGRLASPARFLLVRFGTEVETFSRRPARACSAARALDWFRKGTPEGRTNLFDALAVALAEERVDTVFVLTDGAPSAGEHRTRSGILDEVTRRNRYRKAVIHTVEIGADATGKRWRGFLRQLAESTGGMHVRR